MNEKTDFLCEIGTEELPPLSLRGLSEALGLGIQAGLAKAGLPHGECKLYATPRRLAVWVKDLATRQPDRGIERRGPALAAAYDKEGKPTPQALGFARSCNVAFSQLQQLTTEKGAWLNFKSTEPGRPSTLLLPGIVTQALAELPIPKRMRWGKEKSEFVRPVQWVVMLFGEEVIDAEILGQRAGRETRGHRFHHTGSLVIPTARDYASILETQGFVLPDFALRRAKVRHLVETAAQGLNGTAVLDDSLLDEVTSLVEWPVAVTGNFEARFLTVPAEVIISTMKGKQKYFPIVDAQGALLPHFITISNIESRNPASVREGNERVIRPRLADAVFFWEKDRQQRLETRIEGLQGMLFQERLGTLHDKALRVGRLAATIASQLGSSEESASRAAMLGKCDLLTDMVGEFPELQGIIGRYCAKHDGEPDEVATALEEQYLPRFAGDALPLSPTGQALALADRLDTLVGIFGVGAPPTGDKDPFGLRRSALGALRIIIEGQLDLDLLALLAQSAEIYKDSASHHGKTAGLPIFSATHPDIVGPVYDFMMERLRAYFLEQALQADEFESVVSRRIAKPLDLSIRLRAVHDFKVLPEAVSLVAANKRIKNILRKAQGTLPTELKEHLLLEPAERLLAEQFRALAKETAPLWQTRQYREALQRLAGLRGAVDTFFNEVMVMAEDSTVRENRLILLKGVSDLFLQVADISMLVIGEH